MNILSLPPEIHAEILEHVVAVNPTQSENHAEQAAIQRHALPPVCRQFDSLDQTFILSKDKQIDFEHTQAAIAHFAATCAPGNLGNLKFRNDVHALLKRNTSIAIDFSAMSPHQRITFSDVFEKGNKSGEFKIKNLRIEHAHFFPELKNLDHLRSLEISNSHIESLCPVAQLKSLESLTISCCPNLTVFPAMKNLSNTLVSLDINGCSRMTSLQGLINLEALKSFRIKALHNITQLPILKELTSLQYLQIIKCQKLKILPELPALKALEIVKSPLLQKWPGLILITAPQSFKINGVETAPKTR